MPDSTSHKLRINVFGECDLIVDGVPQDLSSREAKWLITALLLQHDETIKYNEIE